MAGAAHAEAPRLGATERKDAWWQGPVATVLGLGVGFGYLTWAAFLGDPASGRFGSYLSPVYSPPINEWFPWIMDYVPQWVSPAALILWAPGGFRGTCYYYRKAYYRSAFLTPPACAVQGFPYKNYKGEKYFPFILQNVHRYFMYLALLFIFVFLPMDVYEAFWFPKLDGTQVEFGVGLGTVVLGVNALFLAFYTLGCHSLRHLVGGKLDSFSCTMQQKTRYGLWNKVSHLNEYHMLWAWCSLASVTFSDFYIRMCANGILNDIRFF